MLPAKWSFLDNAVSKREPWLAFTFAIGSCTANIQTSLAIPCYASMLICIGDGTIDFLAL